MRVAMLVMLIVMNNVAASAFGEAKIRLAQSSTLTSCMMTCNAAAANCQAGCLTSPVRPTPQATTATTQMPVTNPTATTDCIVTCSNRQLTCQTSCAGQPPSP